MEKRDVDTRKGYNQSTNMSLVQEFQLVVVLCEFFSRPGPDSTRNVVFLSLFGGTLTPSRSSILIKVISTAVSGSIAPLLSAAGTWMQQLSPTSMPCRELAEQLVNHFVIFSKKCDEQLRSLPMVAPRFAANFMTSVADFYLVDTMPSTNKKLVPPPDLLLEIITDWLSDDTSLCLASQPPLALPAGAISMPVVTPLAGLIRWCVMAPLYHKNELYSKLTLFVLQSLMAIPSSAPAPPTALNAQHLGQIVTMLQTYQEQRLANQLPKQENDLQTCLYRLAQAVQVALSVGCMYGNVSQLLCRLETLPKNTLMDLVIKTHKSV